MGKEIEKTAIIGERGKMGRLLSSLMQGAGQKVLALDKPLDRERMDKYLPSCELVLVCTPVEALPGALQEMSPFLSRTSILADISSVKVNSMRRMREIFSGPIVGTHPLFGPEPDAQTELRCALCPDDSANEMHLEKTENLFSSIGLRTFRTTPREHDEAMACIQGLNFITSLCYFASLPRDLDLSKFATPSFMRRMESARKMITEDSDLFTDLFEANPYSAESVRRFKSFLNLAAAGELNLLSDKAAWWWHENHIQSGEDP